MAVVLIGAVLVLIPVRSEFRRLDAEVVEQERLLAHHLGVLAPKPLAIVTNEYGRYGALIKMRGSSDEENSRLLSEVDRLAGENKVVLTSSKPKEGRDKDLYRESYVVSVEVEAGLSQLISFLYALEASPQLLRVDTMALDAKGGKSSDGVHGSLVISKVVTL